MSTLAGAAERKLWVDRGLFELHLNLYILFLAPPGVCAKSVSMGLGLDMLKEAGYATLEDSVLKERIIEEMCEAEKTFEAPSGEQFRHSSITFFADELPVLLASGVDMVKFLVAIYSKKHVYQYRTKNSGIYEVTHPFFNFAANAVPQWFGASVASDMATTGFLARCVIVYEDQKRAPVPHPIVTQKQKRARKRAMQIIYKLSDFYGNIPLSPEANDFYDKWYVKQKISPMEDPRIASYLERRTKAHVLKVAALMALGDLRQIITVKDLQRAIHIIIRTEEKMRMAYMISGANKLAPYVPRILAMIDSLGGKAALSELISAVYTELTSEEFKSLLSMMYQMGEIAPETIGSIKYVRRVKHGESIRFPN